MAAPTIEYTKAAQEQTLQAIRQSQAVVIDAVGAWSKALSTTLPEKPVVPAIPGVPAPQEIIETAFDYYAQVLELQREFVSNLVEAVAPAKEKKPARAAA
jgi:pyrroline-5-carboxylate reductase